MKPKRIAILGSTGSIGRQALEVIADNPALRACALAAGGNADLLADQARRFGPECVALADASAAQALQDKLPDGVEFLAGPEAMTDLVRASKPDVLLSGVVGSAGLAPTLAGIECGATLAIANKETLVMAGAIIMPAAKEAGVTVLPVDSEHSAVFQCLACGRREEVRRVTLTASGGALRDWDDEAAANATLQDALDHPTWQMGRKITIDSATMMNKALEVVEAHWLFGLSDEQIDVVVHDESIVHACVEFCDGSVVAQLARPDMTMPIAYALSYPQRAERGAEALSLAELKKLTFRPLNERSARAVSLGYEVIRRGGTAGAVLNAANEAAVEAFLHGQIRFGQIVPLVENILNQSQKADEVTLTALIDADARVRKEVAQAVEGLDRNAAAPIANRNKIR